MSKREVYDPQKYLEEIGTSLSDFEEVKEEDKDLPFLGKGNFGIVIKAKSKKNSKIYAIKILDKEKNNNNKYFIRETRIPSKLNHQNIIKFYGYFEDKDIFGKLKHFYKDDKKNKVSGTECKEIYCLVLEYAENGSLYDYFKDYKEKNKTGNSFVPIPQENIIKFLKESLKALKYLHEKEKIIHRDISKDNLFLGKNYTIKISDFGLSAKIKEQNKYENNDDNDNNDYFSVNNEGENNDEINLYFNNSMVGRKAMVCHEIEIGDIYDYRADIYSLGLVFLSLISEKYPIEIKRDENKKYKSKIIHDKYIFKIYNIHLVNLIKKMIEKDIKFRPTSTKCCEELEYIEKKINDEYSKLYSDKKNIHINQFNSYPNNNNSKYKDFTGVYNNIDNYSSLINNNRNNKMINNINYYKGNYNYDSPNYNSRNNLNNNIDNNPFNCTNNKNNMNNMNMNNMNMNNMNMNNMNMNNMNMNNMNMNNMNMNNMNMNNMNMNNMNMNHMNNMININNMNNMYMNNMNMNNMNMNNMNMNNMNMNHMNNMININNMNNMNNMNMNNMNSMNNMNNMINMNNMNMNNMNIMYNINMNNMNNTNINDFKSPFNINYTFNDNDNINNNNFSNFSSNNLINSNYFKNIYNNFNSFSNKNYNDNNINNYNSNNINNNYNSNNYNNINNNYNNINNNYNSNNYNNINNNINNNYNSNNYNNNINNNYNNYNFNNDYNNNFILNSSNINSNNNNFNNNYGNHLNNNNFNNPFNNNIFNNNFCIEQNASNSFQNPLAHINGQYSYLNQSNLILNNNHNNNNNLFVEFKGDNLRDKENMMMNQNNNFSTNSSLETSPQCISTCLDRRYNLEFLKENFINYIQNFINKINIFKCTIEAGENNRFQAPFSFYIYLDGEYRKYILYINKIFREFIKIEILPKNKFSHIYDTINYFTKNLYSQDIGVLYYIYIYLIRCPICNNILKADFSNEDDISNSNKISNLNNNCLTNQKKSSENYECDNCCYEGRGKNERGFINTEKYFLISIEGKDKEIINIDNTLDMNKLSLINIRIKKNKLFCLATY